MSHTLSSGRGHTFTCVLVLLFFSRLKQSRQAALVFLSWCAQPTLLGSRLGYSPQAPFRFRYNVLWVFRSKEHRSLQVTVDRLVKTRAMRLFVFNVACPTWELGAVDLAGVVVVMLHFASCRVVHLAFGDLPCSLMYHNTVIESSATSSRTA